MENGLELFYQGSGAVLFCAAVMIMFLLFGRVFAMEEAVRENMQENHIISVTLME